VFFDYYSARAGHGKKGGIEMKLISFAYLVKSGRCLTPCPYGYITKKQEQERGKGYTPSSPSVFSATCMECEYNHGRAKSGSIKCSFDEQKKGEGNAK
jgi:hypothetical protein